jgi:hypothetical protein
MAITQGRLGYVKLATVNYRATEWSVDDRRPLVIPQMIGHNWNTAYAEGLRSAMVNLTFAPARVASAELFSSAFWNLFHQRTFASGFDDLATVAIDLSHGSRIIAMPTCKAASYRLVIAKASQIGLSAQFAHAGALSLSAHTPSAYDNFSNAVPLMDYHASFTGLAAGVKIYRVELSFSNNLLMDAPINTTNRPEGFDPGSPTAKCKITFDGRIVGSNPLATTEGPLTIALSNGTQNTTFSLQSLVGEDPNNQDANKGQNFHSRTFEVLGSASTPPVTVAVT